MKITVQFLEFTFLNELTNKEPTVVSPGEDLLQKVTIGGKLPESFCYVPYHCKNRMRSKAEDLSIFTLS